MRSRALMASTCSDVMLMMRVLVFMTFIYAVMPLA
jgi:hypothetical protein